MCKFSIIVPCYNLKGRVGALFAMLSSDDYLDYEVIYVDDCSKDDTFEQLNKRKEAYNNYKVFQTIKNGGPGKARNLGLSKASGEYILFCDSDDIFDISCLIKIDEFLSNNSDCDLIVSPHCVIGKSFTSTADSYQKYEDGDYVAINDIVNGPGSPWGKVYKASIIRENNLSFPDRMTGEDFCFVVNYAVHVQRAYKMNVVYYKYVMNSGSITHYYRGDYKVPTTFEVLLPIYREHFPQVELHQFIEGHLLERAKGMAAARCSNFEIKQWFKRENARYPNWIHYTTNMTQSVYRRLIYKAMYSANPVFIKAVMFIRKILY